jgi:hypothetical protein
MKITISVSEYRSLRKDSETLNLLEVSGVDNWGYYGDALNPEGTDYDTLMEEVDKEIDEMIENKKVH